MTSEEFAALSNPYIHTNDVNTYSGRGNELSMYDYDINIQSESSPITHSFMSAISSSQDQNKNLVVKINDDVTRDSLLGPKVTHEVTIRTTGKRVCVLIDTGSGVNLCSPRVVELHKLQTFRHNIPIMLSGFLGPTTRPELVVLLPIRVGSEDVDLYAFVCESPLLERYDMVMGTSVLGQKLGLCMLPNEAPSILIPRNDSDPTSAWQRIQCKSCVNTAVNMDVSTVSPRVAQINHPVEICSASGEQSKLGPSTTETESTSCCSLCSAKFGAKSGEAFQPTLSRYNETERAPGEVKKSSIHNVPSEPNNTSVRKTRKGRKKRREENFSINLKSCVKDKNKTRKIKKALVRKERKVKNHKIKKVLKNAAINGHEPFKLKEIHDVDHIAAIIEAEGHVRQTMKQPCTIKEYIAAVDVGTAGFTENQFTEKALEAIQEMNEATVAGIEVMSTPSTKLDEYEFDLLGEPVKQTITDEEYWELSSVEKQMLKDLLDEFADVIVEDHQVTYGEAKVPPFDIELKEGAEEILKTGQKTPYPIKGDLRVRLTQNYKEMEESGIGSIARPGDDIRVVSPGFYVFNSKAKKYRLVTDYNRSKLNEATIDYQYPLPSIDDIVHKLGRKRYKSVLDCIKGFNQIPLTRRAQALLVMITPEGLFKYKVMTFGPKNAPRYFQHVMDMVIEEARREGYALIYIDDLFVGSDTFEEHLNDLRRVFLMLRKANIKVGKAKVKLCLKRAKYCGRLISHDGLISPDPHHLKVLADFPTPKNVQNVQEFLGLCNYVSAYNPDYAHIAAPLTALTSKKVKFEWTPERDHAFSTLKKEMIRISSFMIPDYSKPFRTRTDASKIAASCVISQEDPNKKGSWVPVFCSSWVFNKSQRDYNPADREALALLWTVRKYRYIFYGRDNVVETDNSAITGEWDVQDPFGKRARWKDELAQYNIHLRHIPREENQAADALSKNLPPYLNDVAEIVAATEVLAIPSDEEWKAAQRQDKDLAPIITYIDEGTVPRDKQLALKIVRESRYYALNASGILERLDYNKNNEITARRRVVPLVFKKLILGLYHDSKFGGSHLGRQKTYERVARNFYFENMRKYVAVYVKTCVLCQKIKNPKVKSTASVGQIPASRPWEKVSIDGWGPWKPSKNGNTHAHVVLDECTKFLTILPTPDKSAVELAKKLRDIPFRIFGYPESLHHDLGKEYTNEVLKALCELCGIDETRTTIYHPQGNGTNERIHQFIRNAVVAAIADDERYWDQYLIEIEQAWNTAMGELGYTPSQAFLGRQIRVPGDIPPVERQDMNYMDFIDQFKYVQSRAQVLLLEKRIQRQLKRDKDQIPLTEFKPGDQVLMYLPRVLKQGESYKLHAHWQGPYTIDRRGKNPKVYYLLDQFNDPYGAPVSVLNLKPYHDRLKMMKGEYTILESIEDSSLNKINDESEMATQDDEIYVPDLEDLPIVHNLPPKEKLTSDEEIILPNTRENRRMIGHEAYVREDGKIVLKARVFR